MKNACVISPLKPCPFCKSNDIYFLTDKDRYHDTVVIYCNNCRQQVILIDNEHSGKNTTTIRRAVEAWNKRG